MKVCITGDYFVLSRATGWDDPGFAAFAALLQSADCVLGNLDSTLTDRGYPVRKPDIFRGELRVAQELKTLGLDVVSLANNHSQDFGLEGLEQTWSALSDVGIEAVGVGVGVHQAFAPRFVKHCGITVAVVACYEELMVADPSHPERLTRQPEPYTLGVAVLPCHPVARWTGKHPTERLFLPDAVLMRAFESSIATARETADLVVAYCHSHRPLGMKSPELGYTVPYAAIDAGADIVVGHGSHQVEPVEMYKNKLIFHGLGNTFFQIPPPASYHVFPEYLGSLKRVSERTEAWHGVALMVHIDGTGQLEGVDIVPLDMAQDSAHRGWPLCVDASFSKAVLNGLTATDRSQPTLENVGAAFHINMASQPNTASNP